MKINKKIFIIFLFSILFNQLYSQENLHDFLEKLYTGNYVIDFYCDVLKSGKRDTMHNFSDVYKNREYSDPDYGVVKYKWYDMEIFSMDSIIIRIDDYTYNIDNDFFEISSHGIYPQTFSNRNNVEITFEEDVNNNLFDDDSSLNWKLVRQNRVNTFYFRFDGDYLYVYLNEEKEDSLFATFVNLNDETFKEFKYLIENDSCDLSRVTWPRHADGTCDYDDEIKPPKVQLSDNGFVAEEEEEIATPSDPLSDDEEDVKTVEETVPSVKKFSTLPLVIIVVSVAILLFIVIILFVRKKKKQ